MIYNEKHSVRFSLPGRQERCYDKIDLSEIFRKIQDKEPLCLNRVALEGFSVNAYRKYYHLPADEMIEIWIDSITDCLFLGKDGNALDLSYCRLRSPDPVAGVSLEDNIFYKGKVDFSCSRIDEEDLSLTGSSFWDTELDFDFTEFGEKDLYLNKTNFYGQDSAIHFNGTDFGMSGEVIFSYMSGLKGMVEFYRCTFGENMLDFAYMNCPECQFIFWDLDVVDFLK